MIRFSDLESGPNTGGQNNGGAFVTIYGTHFGATRGTSLVTVGGGAVLAYPIWSDSKVTVQLGPLATSGNIVVTTPAGASNAIPFTVRPGNLYFVATSGSNSNNGSFAAPWLTLLKARDSISAGDIVYAMNGVSQTTDDGQGWSTSMLLRVGGNPGAPMAMVAYPGATVTVGSPTGPTYGIRGVDTGTLLGNWVFAGLVLRGSSAAMALAGPSANWRIIGNDMSCPNGNGETGCFGTSRSSYVYFYGNNVHDAGTASASAHYHGVYWSTDSNYIDMGWNAVANVHGCRGVQIWSSPLGSGGASDPTGYDLHNISIHDNLIHDTQCDGIILSSIDPSQGKVEVYNNIIYNAGKGPANPENTGAWTCVNVPGADSNGTPGAGIVDVYNNTMYNCGSFANPPYQNANAAVENGGNNTNIKIRLRNNIMYQTSAEPYLVIYGPADGIQGSNNLFFGNGAPPANPNITQSVNSDPLFANLGSYDFHLTASSPAATGGTTTPQSRDFDSLPLPQGAGYPIGALAYPAAGSPITVTITPSSISLQAGQSRQFTASVSGTGTTGVTWSMNPTIGTLSSSGMYTAPASIPTQQTVVVTATSVADASRFASATITLTALVDVTVSPASVGLTAGQHQQFSDTVSGATNTAVTWSMSPVTGTLSSSGLYTAPASITAQQSVVITATSAADPTKSSAATVTLKPVTSVVVTPASVSLGAGQSRQFTATVSGTASTAVTWSMSPPVGTLSSAGYYTAPASITSQQSVVVTATLVADPTKSSSATITLTPATSLTPISVTVTPGVISLGAGQGQQFTATVNGATNTAVTWTRSPSVGTLSASGYYSAPASIASQQSVFITATSAADPTKSSTATVTLIPPTVPQATGFSVRWTPLNSTQVQVFWTAPAGEPSADWIGLSGVGSPGWWYVWYKYTGGATSGTIVVNLPLSPGYYEFRYYLKGSYTIKARSAAMPVAVSGFNLTAGPATAAVNSPLTVSWKVPSGRPWTDSVGLYPIGAANDQDVWHQYPKGATSGTYTIPAPATPGTYEFRWRIGYLVAARSAPITVK